MTRLEFARLQVQGGLEKNYLYEGAQKYEQVQMVDNHIEHLTNSEMLQLLDDWDEYQLAHPQPKF